MDLPQLGEPIKLPKAKMLCCAPVLSNAGLVPFLCRELQWGFGHSCSPLKNPHSEKEHPEKGKKAGEGSRKTAL